MSILVYANPVLLLWIWLKRFKRGRSYAPKWKAVMLWVSMILASAAVLAFWSSIFSAPLFSPQWDLAMKVGTRLSLLAASGAIIAAILGEGPERKWVILSSIAIPTHWIMASVWQ